MALVQIALPLNTDLQRQKLVSTSGRPCLDARDSTPQCLTACSRFRIAAFSTISRNCPNHVLARVVEPKCLRSEENIASTIDLRW